MDSMVMKSVVPAEPPRPLMVGIASDASEARDHRHGMRRLRNGLEAEALVPRDLPSVGAEADRLEATRARPVEQCLEQLLACALAAAARDNGDRQLRRLLVDEAEPRLVGGEEAIPRGAVCVRPIHRDDARVAGAAPV